MPIFSSKGLRSGLWLWLRSAVGELVRVAGRTAAYHVGTGPTSSLVLPAYIRPNRLMASEAPTTIKSISNQLKLVFVVDSSSTSITFGYINQDSVQLQIDAAGVR